MGYPLNDNDPLGILAPPKESSGNGDPLGILKKKIGGGINGSQSDNPFLNAQKPSGVISNEQVLQGEQQLSEAKNKNIEGSTASAYGENISKAAQEKKEQDTNAAAINTAHQFFKNNPYTLKELSKSNDKLSLKNAEGKEIEGEYSLKHLQKSSLFDKKVAELKNAYDNGELTTYKSPTGELKLGRTMKGWDSFAAGFKDAWYAKGEANKILSMKPDEFIKHTNEALSKDEEYLPVKQNTESFLYQIGSSVPLVGKGVVGAALGSAMAAAVPETGGFSATGLPALMAWMATVPDMADQARANALVEYYKRAKQEGNDDKTAYSMAIKGSDAAGAEALLTGTALNTIVGLGIPANTGQGLLRATGQWLKNQPQSLVAATSVSAGGSYGKDVLAKNAGFDISPQEMLDNANKAGGQMFVSQLAFNIAFGGVAAPKFVKAQALETLTKANPEAVQQFTEQSVVNGWLTQEQADKGLHDIQQYSEIRKTIPENISEEKAAAVTGLVLKNKNLEAEKKFQNPIFHDDINAEIKNNEQKAKDILNSDKPLQHETDNLTGERGMQVGGRPKKEEAQVSEIAPKETVSGTTTENERITAVESKPTEKVVGGDLQKPKHEVINDYQKEISEIGGRKELAAERLKAKEISFDEWHKESDNLLKEQFAINDKYDKLLNGDRMGQAGDKKSPTLYHFTGKAALKDVLDENSISGEGKEGGEYGGVSTSTDPDLDNRNVVLEYGNLDVGGRTTADATIRIDFDKQKLKDDGYKIVLGNDNMGTSQNEQEMRIFKLNEGQQPSEVESTEIPNVKKYIKNIRINPKKISESELSSIKTRLEKENIPYTIKGEQSAEPTSTTETIQAPTEEQQPISNSEVETKNLSPLNIEQNAVSKQSADASLLRQERPEMGLPQVGARNAEPEIIAGTEVKKEKSPISNEEKIGDAARKLAQKIRSGKINKLGGFKTSTGFDAVWDASLEVVAKTLEGGAKVADAIEAGLKYIRSTDWYKKLTDKKDFEDKYITHVSNEFSEAAIESGGQQRRFSKQVLRDEDLTIESKEEISKTLKYVKQTNAMSIDEASRILKTIGADEAQNLVISDGDIKPAVRVVLGQSLIKHFNDLAVKAADQATKDFYNDKTIQTAKFVTEKLATEPGQMIQAFSLYSRLSPEAQLRDAIQDAQIQAKDKMRQRKPNINKISDKFKKANQETADELTDNQKIKSAVKNASDLRIKKSKNKIESAKKRREQLIKKYKSGKGKTLYSSIGGLTPEGIEFVGDVVRTYIDEGVANLEILFEKVRSHLEEIGKKATNDEVQKQIRSIAQEHLDKAVDKNIYGGIQDLEGAVGKIIKEHYTVSEEQRTSLMQKFIDKSGLDKEEAEQLAKDVQQEFDRIATRKKLNILYHEKSRFDKIRSGLKSDKKVEPKSVQRDLIKYTNLGAFENNDFADIVFDKFGIGKLTPEQTAKLSELAEKVQKAPEGSPKNAATEDLLKYRATLRGDSWAEIAQGVWYAEILSGYKTHEKNIVSTFFNSMAYFASEAAKSPKEIPFLVYGGLKGLKRGALEAWHTFTTGRSPIHIRKIETPQVLERQKFVGGYLNPANYLKFVSRAMIAEDVLQFQGLKEMRAYQLAAREAHALGYRDVFAKETWEKVNELLLNTTPRWNEAREQVKEEGLTGIEAKRRLYELVENSRPIQMTENAYGFAAKGTFNHDTEGTLGALTNAIGVALDTPIGGTKPLRFIVPFTRIISNVVNNALDFSPVGFIRAARGIRGFRSFEKYNVSKTAFKELTKEERQQLVARASLGVGIAAAFQALNNAGMVQITGGGTGDYKKDAELQQEGWQPYSIKIGDTYYSYKLTPLVFSLGFLGNMNDKIKYAKNEDDATFFKRMELAAYRTGNLIGDMTWINSGGTLLGAFQNPNSTGLGSDVSNALQQSAKGFVVPQAYTQAAQEMEHIFNMPQKQVNTLWDNVIQDVPIARNRLNDKINALGDPITRDVDVFTSEEAKDPVWKYLVEKNGWVAPISKNSFIVWDGSQERQGTQDEYYNFSKLRGQKIKAAILSAMEGGFILNEGTDKEEAKSANEITSAELQKALRTISAKATKEAKMELFNPDNITKPRESVKLLEEY